MKNKNIWSVLKSETNGSDTKSINQLIESFSSTSTALNEINDELVKVFLNNNKKFKLLLSKYNS